MEKRRFLDVFEESPNGSLSPKMAIEINGVRFGTGTAFQKGVSLGGIDFHLYKYNDIAVEVLPDGALKIEGFYKDA